MPDRQAGTDAAAMRERLRQFLQENIPLLLGIVRSYVVRMELARGESVQNVAADILQDAAFEALSHADRFDPTASPKAWFLGIVANIIKRRKVEGARRHKREISLNELSTRAEIVDEYDFFDLVVAHSCPGPEQALESDEQVTEMLSLVSADDQLVLRLALLHDLNMRSLAQRLDISPGAARVRLHRALHRLRAAWCKHERSESHE